MSKHKHEEPNKLSPDEQVPLKDTPETNTEAKPMVAPGTGEAPPPNMHASPKSSRPGSNNPMGSDTGSYNPQSGTGNAADAAEPKDADGKPEDDE